MNRTYTWESAAALSPIGGRRLPGNQAPQGGNIDQNFKGEGGPDGFRSGAQEQVGIILKQTFFECVGWNRQPQDPVFAPVTGNRLEPGFKALLIDVFSNGREDVVPEIHN